MKRGDIITVAAAGDYGKPRPAVVIQSDAFPPDHPSVIVCQMTAQLSAAEDFQLIVEPAASTGLRVRSQIMVDKPVTVRRERVGKAIGRLHREDIRRLDRALAFVMGLAD